MKKNDSKKEGGNKKALTIFMLIMINVAAVLSLSKIPTMSVYGLSAIFFIGAIALIFFVPVSLVSAELATAFPSSRNGIYSWVKEAFGAQWGFLAIWLQWFSQVVNFPVLISTASACIAFALFPSLATDPLFTFVSVIVIIWLLTLINFKGMRVSGWISSIFALCGTILPGLLIILLGALYFMGGNFAITWVDLGTVIPDFSHLTNVVFLASIFLAFCGMEMSAVHAKEVNDPQKTYPKAILFSALLVIGIYALGSLSISISVPKSDIEFNAGVVEAFQALLKGLNISFLLPIISLLIALGLIGSLSTWMAGPSKGLLATANDDVLPRIFKKTNQNGMPVNILITQAAFVTILGSIFLLSKSINVTFTFLLVLASQVYLLMYFMLFATAIKLRLSKPKMKRPFRVPGGSIGMWIVCLIGMAATLLAIFLGFHPPVSFSHMTVRQATNFNILLGVGLFFICLIPLVLHEIRSKSRNAK